MAHRILIIGGGFGGFSAARTLERLLPGQAARITLVSDSNFMLYAPLLPGAAAGSLEPRHVVVPLREELGHTHLLVASLTEIDAPARTATVRTPDRREMTLEYDQLVLALGSISRTLPIPGLAEHGVGFKTLPDAIRLRNHVLRTLEIAESVEDHVERRKWLTYVFVGAGYAGLEGLAELQDFAADVIEHYPRCRLQSMRWILVEARDQVMPEVGARLARFAAGELRGRGIEVMTETTLDSLTADAATLSTGEVVETKTLVWTAGVAPVSLAARLGLPLGAGGRIATAPTLQVEGQREIWAIGDIAAVPDPARSGQPCPPTAQHAQRQGRLVAHNIAALIRGADPQPFRYKTRGVFVDMGQGQAVANVMGVKLRGALAWWLARTYHLAAMPGIKRRWRLLVDWNVQLLFGRDSSELGTLGHARPLGEGDAPEPARTGS